MLSEKEKRLIDAVHCGNKKITRKLLKGGIFLKKISPHIVDEHGWPLLCLAADMGDLPIVNQLLAAGAYVNEVNKNGETALYVAAAIGYLPIVDRLLKAGAEVDQARTTDGATPLFVAAFGGDGDHLPIVNRLLKAHARVDKARIDGTTPLFVAVAMGYLPIVDQLLKACARVDEARIDDGTTPLCLAADIGHLPVVDRLLTAGAEVDKARISGTTPLLIAAKNGHLPVVDRLLRAGAEVDKARTTDGLTPLCVAAKSGHLEIVRVLYIVGANLNIKDSNNKTALDWVREKRHTEIVDFLSFPSPLSSTVRSREELLSLASTEREAAEKRREDEEKQREEQRRVEAERIAQLELAAKEKHDRYLMKELAEIPDITVTVEERSRQDKLTNEISTITEQIIRGAIDGLPISEYHPQLLGIVEGGAFSRVQKDALVFSLNYYIKQHRRDICFEEPDRTYGLDEQTMAAQRALIIYTLSQTLQRYCHRKHSFGCFCVGKEVYCNIPSNEIFKKLYPILVAANNACLEGYRAAVRTPQ